MAWKTEATVSHLSDTLKDTAGKSLPEKCYKKPHKWKDATVSALCAQSPAYLEGERMPKRSDTYNLPKPICSQDKRFIDASFGAVA